MNLQVTAPRMVRVAFVLSLFFMVAEVHAAGPEYRLEVDGLACPFCAYGIEKKLHAVPGVEGVETHIGEGAVIVTMEEGIVLDEAIAKQAVREAGFTLRGFAQVSPPSEQ